MQYTTQEKVQAMFRDLQITSDSVITISDMTEFILEIDAVIDGKLNPYYETPITGVESLKIVGLISKLKVSQMVWDVLELDSKESDIEQAGAKFGKRGHVLLMSLLPQYNKTAKRFDEPVTKLTDAVAKATSPDTGSLFNSQRLENTGSEGVSTVKGGNNW